MSDESSNWEEVSLGADVGPHAARVATVDGGHLLHGYLKFQRPGERAYMLQATIDLRPLEKQIEEEAVSRLPPGAVSGGRFFKRLRARIKKVAKKIGKSKLVRGIARVAKKVIDNPIVKGILASNPYGAAFLAVRAAGRVAARAIKGGKKAKQFIADVAHRVKRGDHGALKVARLLKQGIKYSGIARRLPLPAAVAGADEPEFLAQVLGAVATVSDPQTISLGNQFHLVAGDDGASEEQEIDSVDQVATSGAFEGTRWLANRLGLHSMAADPNEFSARNALMLGHSVMSRARSGHGGYVSHEQYDAEAGWAAGHDHHRGLSHYPQH